MAAICAGRFKWRNWTADRFTAITIGGRPASIQALSCCTAVRMTQLPMAMIWPLFSASGMNSPGATMPSCGCFQRSSASTPTTRLPSIDNCGW